MQQDGAPPHLCREVRRFLNEQLPEQWIGRSVPNTDLPPEEWPPRSPDITPYDFFLWGYVTDHVFVPSLHRNLQELKESIMAAVSAINTDKIQMVCDELDYMIDVCSVTKRCILNICRIINK
jgi:hypothetical protein